MAMSSNRKSAAGRLAILGVLLASFSMALLQPASAGSESSPEVQDPTGDVQSTRGLLAISPLVTIQTWTEIDIVKAWFTVNGTNLTTTIQVAGTASATATYAAKFNVTSNGTTTARELRKAGSTVTPTGTTAVVAGRNVTFTTSLAALNLTAGGNVTGLVIVTSNSNTGLLPTADDDQSGTDTAGPGLAFFYSTQSPPVVNPNDTDGDGLNDTCEMTYWGNLTATNNATADEDGDGLTNAEECALGTNPRIADTDGDGVNDKDDPFPLDPTQGGLNSTTNTTTSTNTTTTTTSGTTTTGNGTTTTDGSIDGLGDVIDALQADLGYFGGSFAGLLAVLALCILALAVRWSL
jgi:hypothetical protein